MPTLVPPPSDVTPPGLVVVLRVVVVGTVVGAKGDINESCVFGHHMGSLFLKPGQRDSF